MSKSEVEEQPMSDDGQEQLYEISIAELGLSGAAIQILNSVGATSIGDCLDYYSLKPGTMISVPFGYIEMMETEVKQKLIEHGYLTDSADKQ